MPTPERGARRGGDGSKPGRGDRGPDRRGDRGADRRGDRRAGGTDGGANRSGSGRAGGRGSDRRGGTDDRRGGTRRADQRSGGRGRREEAGSPERTTSQAAYDGPPIPEQVTGKELDRSVLAQLQSLPEKLGQRVARHLVSAGLLMGDDPTTAYQHTLAAKARAGRLAVVREAVGEAAYAAGEFSVALTELKAARRMNGARDYVAMIADCERALGRPDRALEVVRAASRDDLPRELAAELTIVEAGARRDRGELDAALRTLEQAPLQSTTRAPWVVRLRYAYADALLAAGRPADALEWFHRAEAFDAEQVTDAAERVAELERSLES